MKKIFLILLLIILVLLFGCTSEQEPVDLDDDEIIIDLPVANGLANFKTLDDSKLTIEALEELILANNNFAIDYYNKIDSSEKNIFFSPFSISTAIAMTYEGADRTTADEIRNVFYFPEDDEKRRSAFARVYNNLNQSASKGNYTINIANALWNEQKYPFKQSFYDTIEKYYYGKSKSVDFINNPEEQRQEINLWVEDQTNKKIVELLPKASIKDVTRMVLVNAIYFKGDWNTKFDEENTYGGLFNTSLENSEEVQMMYQKNKFNYYEDDSFQYLELPYKGNDVSMIIILPKEIVIDYKIPSASELLNMKLTMINQEVEVHLPKFKFETKYKLKNDLIEMGVKEAFTNDADFSKMDEENFVKIDEIYHQAFIEINEEGTEAAAATAVVIIEKTSMPLNTVFNANRPFTFYIQNNEANEILFLGKMIDPNK